MKTPDTLLAIADCAECGETLPLLLDGDEQPILCDSCADDLIAERQEAIQAQQEVQEAHH